jgi:hypothetical protein
MRKMKTIGLEADGGTKTMRKKTAPGVGGTKTTFLTMRRKTTVPSAAERDAAFWECRRGRVETIYTMWRVVKR